MIGLKGDDWFVCVGVIRMLGSVRLYSLSAV